ncbi:MAG: class I SAM-dependent methyltransferase [Dongiaceae bacterium]
MDTQPAIAFRADYRTMKTFYGERRGDDRLVAHYRLERTLAGRLLQATDSDRGQLYVECYAELFEALPDHPQRDRTAADRRRRVRDLLVELTPYLRADATVLEIGCGDALLSSALAARVARVYAVDVTDALIDRPALPGNVAVLLSRGTDLALPADSVDLAISDQLLEHLHPEDVRAHLAQVRRALRPGGRYCCITPNRAVGPHDISCYFDAVAAGFHLREYDSRSIAACFAEAGFRRVEYFSSLKGVRRRVPASLLRACETLLLRLPATARSRLSRSRITRMIAGLEVVGIK